MREALACPAVSPHYAAMKTHPRIAVSTWSLHNAIGITHANGPSGSDTAPAVETYGKPQISLLDLPAVLRKQAYARVELCHFHLARLDPVYLEEVRSAFTDAGIIIQTLLIDDGDITMPATRARDMAWINKWIGAAARLGAVHARVIAGKQKPSAETMALAVTGLTHLSNAAATQGVKLVTENWFDLTASPTEVHHILDRVPGLGLLADTGNWSGPAKYADLANIFARAQLCHAKAFFTGNIMDEKDFAAGIKAAERVGYKGPYTLIFADEGDEWQGLAKERGIILDLIQSPDTGI